MDAWLYIVLLGAVIMVFARLQPQSSGTSVSTVMMKEIEDTIDHFSSEIEEENRNLMKLVSGLKTEHEEQVRTLLARIDDLERQSRGLTEQVSEMSKAKSLTQAASLNASNDENASALAAEHPEWTGMNIKTRYAEIFRLQHEGKSIDVIARKLEMNKGEVMLIIQLGKQEEQFRV